MNRVSMKTRPEAEYTALIDTLRDFIDTEVIPREDLKTAHDSKTVERVATELNALARARADFAGGTGEARAQRSGRIGWCGSRGELRRLHRRGRRC